VDLPRQFVIRESSHRIHNPIDEVKLATLGRALRPVSVSRLVDLPCACG
jgi:hypothetical protein